MPPKKPKPQPSLPAVEGLTYEQALEGLESIVTSLESNKLALEETMSLYERGQELTRHCVEMLDKAELRVRQLSGENLADLNVEE